MVPDDHEHGDPGIGELRDALGELALVCLAGVAALVCVTAEQCQVDLVLQRVVDDLIQGVEEVGESGGQAGLGVWPTVVFYAYVYVAEV